MENNPVDEQPGPSGLSDNENTSRIPKHTTRRRSNPPELENAAKQMKQAFDTLNNALQAKKNVDEDEYDLFGKLIAKRLKRLPSEDEREGIMYEIEEIFHKRHDRRLFTDHRPSDPVFSRSNSSLSNESQPSSASTSYFPPHKPSTSRAQFPQITTLMTLPPASNSSSQVSHTSSAPDAQITNFINLDSQAIISATPFVTYTPQSYSRSYNSQPLPSQLPQINHPSDVDFIPEGDIVRKAYQRAIEDK